MQGSGAGPSKPNSKSKPKSKTSTKKNKVHPAPLVTHESFSILSQSQSISKDKTSPKRASRASR
jgi:hypothetical protein